MYQYSVTNTKCQRLSKGNINAIIAIATAFRMSDPDTNMG